MGKKIKKEEKGSAEDTFDPLLVESRQAETVVLMLSSPEEEVQNKACEAIYKFVSKCDENKETMAKLNVSTELMRLMKSEEKVTRRNAVMALAVLSEHNEVRKILGKEEALYPILLGLLSFEEFPTTNEFSAMTLQNLCQEYTSVYQVLKNNGVKPLVECLRSEDPDVQKNAIYCLDLVLRDFEARPLLKTCDGITAMLDLLKSEYPIIQETSLKALAKAVLDSHIRAVVRDMNCLNVFVEIIGNAELNDIHVFSLQVLASCTEDIECVKQMKENGGLVRLIAFIADAQPPEDEVNSKPKKSSKAGSAKKKKKEDEEKVKESVPSSTMPEVKVQACKAIMKACRIDEVRKLFHECDVERLLVSLLSHESEPVRVAAAQAIGTMALSVTCQNEVFNLGGIEQLVKLIKSDHKELKEASSLALANLTTGNAKICQDVTAKHGLEHLVACLSCPQEGICSNALVAISNMSTDEAQRTKLLQYGLAKALIGPLKSTSPAVQSKAALAVAGFLVDIKSRSDFRKKGGNEALNALLFSNNVNVRRSVCWAITVVASEKESAEELCALGALKTLQSINRSENKRNKFSEAAENRLYDSSINLKYAMIGYLDFTDHIEDIFFDCGQQKAGSTIQSIESYGMEPINNKRSIMLINTTQPRPVTPALSFVIDTEEKKTSEEKLSVKKKGSRTKKDSRRSSTVLTEGSQDSLNNIYKIDESKPSTPAYRMPADPNLLKYIEEVIEKIMPEGTMEEQASHLARFVAESMGGAIPEDALMSFPYELSISQLKVEFRSNVIPIGFIKMGIQIHRALLFKFLADRIFLPTNLHRGEYNRAWNEIWLIDPHDRSSRAQLHIVDLVHVPGRLIPFDSPAGHAYRRL